MAYLYTTYIQCTMYFLDGKHLKLFVKKKKCQLKNLEKGTQILENALRVYDISFTITILRTIVHTQFQSIWMHNKMLVSIS